LEFGFGYGIAALAQDKIDAASDNQESGAPGGARSEAEISFATAIKAQASTVVVKGLYTCSQMTASKQPHRPRGWALKLLQRNEHFDSFEGGFHLVFSELCQPASDYPFLCAPAGTGRLPSQLLPAQLRHIVQAIGPFTLKPISFIELARFAGFDVTPRSSASAIDIDAPNTDISPERAAALSALAGSLSQISDPTNDTRWQPSDDPTDSSDTNGRGRRLLLDILLALSRAKSLSTPGNSLDDMSTEQHVAFLEEVFDKFSIDDKESLRSLTNLRRIALDHKHDVNYLNVIGTITSSVLNTVAILMTNINSL